MCWLYKSGIRLISPYCNYIDLQNAHRCYPDTPSIADDFGDNLLSTLIPEGKTCSHDFCFKTQCKRRTRLSIVDVLGRLSIHYIAYLLTCRSALW